jgi:hypothetical protein
MQTGQVVLQYPTIGTSINGLQTVNFKAQGGLKQATTLDGVKNLFWVGRIAAPVGSRGMYIFIFSVMIHILIGIKVIMVLDLLRQMLLNQVFITRLLHLFLHPIQMLLRTLRFKMYFYHLLPMYRYYPLQESPEQRGIRVFVMIELLVLVGVVI